LDNLIQSISYSEAGDTSIAKDLFAPCNLSSRIDATVDASNDISQIPNDEVNSKSPILYSEEFIEALRDKIFSSIDSIRELSAPHRPILLSIEGNIGAGKST
jgi:hypothetical protein